MSHVDMYELQNFTKADERQSVHWIKLQRFWLWSQLTGICSYDHIVQKYDYSYGYGNCIAVTE